MSQAWGYGFLVGPTGDRDDRYSQVTSNNPSINNATRADADRAFAIACSYIDDDYVTRPYQILANGVRSTEGETPTYVIQVQVVGHSDEE